MSINQAFNRPSTEDFSGKNEALTKSILVVK